MKVIYIFILSIVMLSCVTTKKITKTEDGFEMIHFKNDSIKHGKFKSYNTLGVLNRKMKYKNNLLHGKMAYYHPNGKIAGFYRSKSDTLTGPFKFFYPNGNKKFTINYLNNKPQEVINCYSPKKETISCGTLKNGNGYVIQYNDDGKFSSKDYYSNGNYLKSDTIL